MLDCAACTARQRLTCPDGATELVKAMGLLVAEALVIADELAVADERGFADDRGFADACGLPSACGLADERGFADLPGVRVGSGVLAGSGVRDALGFLAGVLVGFGVAVDVRAVALGVADAFADFEVALGVLSGVGVGVGVRELPGLGEGELLGALTASVGLAAGRFAVGVLDAAGVGEPAAGGFAALRVELVVCWVVPPDAPPLGAGGGSVAGGSVAGGSVAAVELGVAVADVLGDPEPVGSGVPVAGALVDAGGLAGSLVEPLGVGAGDERDGVGVGVGVVVGVELGDGAG